MNNKDQLLENIEKRFKTTMIGALAKFEENFAYLWENDTINRERYEDLWEETNHQTRSALKELHQYLYGENTNFNQKYHYKFYFKNPGDDK